MSLKYLLAINMIMMEVYMKKVIRRLKFRMLFKSVNSIGDKYLDTPFKNITRLNKKLQYLIKNDITLDDDLPEEYFKLNMLDFLTDDMIIIDGNKAIKTLIGLYYRLIEKINDMDLGLERSILHRYQILVETILKSINEYI